MGASEVKKTPIYKRYDKLCFKGKTHGTDAMRQYLSELPLRHKNVVRRPRENETIPAPAGVAPCRFFPFRHCLRIECFSRHATKAACGRDTLEYNSHIQTACFYKVVLK
jgi:hypothetical protein